MLSNISKGQSSIPLKYLLAGLEEEFSSMRSNIRLMFVEPKLMEVKMFYKAPSNTVPNLYYDVVFEFHGNRLVKIDTNTPFKVYCNSPSFYFRYANTFKNCNSLLYPEKYPAMVDDDAKVRNPSQVKGFDKYVYSCLRLSMLAPIQDLRSTQYLDRQPQVDTFNKKRFEYLKYQKLKKVAEDGIVV
jgi:hypothetical protein